MAYTLEHNKLRVARALCLERKEVFGKLRIIILEHLLPTTEEFVYLLSEAGADIFALLAKPYSIDPDVEERINNYAHADIPILKHSYDELENTDIIPRLLEAAEKASSEDGRDILIVDVGGYFAKPLVDRGSMIGSHIKGVVEDTTFGHNRYKEHCKDIDVPVYSVARSVLKEIEARFVGGDAVKAMDILLREQGVSLPGRNALVIGYGMIGKNVARALQANDLRVHVYDKEDTPLLAAFIDGYHVRPKLDLLKHANIDIIFCATGDPNGALSFQEIEDCRDNVILVSVGSKDTEFDLAAIEAQKVTKKKLGKYITEYGLNSNRRVLVAKDGTAVNFALPSIPNEVLDLVFSEIATCLLWLAKESQDIPPGRLYEVPEKPLNTISKRWLRFQGR